MHFSSSFLPLCSRSAATGLIASIVVSVTVDAFTPAQAGGNVLYRFQGGSDGSYPNGGVIIDNQGALYGTTSVGGSFSSGTVFKLTPPPAGQTQWTEAVLYGFQGGANGANPNARLVFDGQGALYGTTRIGGTWNYGTVFKLTPPAEGQTQWTQAVLYNFTDGLSGPTDGGQPYAGMTFDQQGALYGTTYWGGTANCGTVFKLTPPAVGQAQWTETLLYSFQCPPDGAAPAAGLIFGEDGALYGTTTTGGNCAIYICGTVFKLSPPAAGQSQWIETVLYNFMGQPDGVNPSSSLIFDAHGALYGTTTSGGALNYGSVFKVAPPKSGTGQWSETILHSFTYKLTVPHEDGSTPYGNLIFDEQGALYGTSFGGGKWGSGTIFELRPPEPDSQQWSESVVYSFTGGTDGAFSYAGPILGAQNELYVTAYHGGSQGNGTVLQLQCTMGQLNGGRLRCVDW